MENNLIYILNKKEKIINILHNTDGHNKCPFFDDLLSQSLSTGADTYKFSTIFNDKNSATILVGNKVAFMYKGDFLLFQIISVDEIHNENMEIEVYCESAGLSLINNVCRKTSLISSDIRKFLETVLQDTEWNVGFVDMSITNSIDVEIPTASVYSILQNNLSRYKAEIRFRCELNNGRISKKYVDVFKERGRFTGKRFEFGKNIEGLTRSVDSSELYTALIGEGKNGIDFKDIELPDVPNKPMGADFVYDQESFNLYNHNGYHLMGVYKFETESPEELLRETYKKLQECKNPKITYDVNVSLLDYDVSVGDTVNIIDRFFNPPLFLKARVNKLEESLTDKNIKKCVLSNFIEVRSNINSSLLDQIKDFVNNTVTDRFPIGTDDIQDGAVNGDKIYESSITTDHLIAGSVTADKIQANSIRADHIAANQIKAQHIEAGSIDATKIQAESIESKHIVANAIKSEHIDTGSITTDKLDAGSVTADKIQTGAITAGSGIIADGAIGSAQISYLEANKIRSGTIDTSLVTITGAEGHMEISGNQIMVNDKGKNRVTMGEYRTGKGDEVKFGLLVRDEDGETVMIDGKGVHNAGITDGAIDDNKVSDSANISGTKLNINSVIREVNENGTESIKGTKVVVGDRSLEVELSEQKNIITEHGKEISTQKSEIQALDDQIKLKVDNQTFTEATNTINNKIDTTKDEVKEENKTYTDLQIDYVNKGLEKNTSEINILKDEISTKVTQADIDRTVANIKLGGRNLVLNSKVEESSNENEFAIRKTLQLNSETSYTLSANACMKSNNSNSKLIIVLSPSNGGWEQTLTFEPNGKTEIKEVTFSTIENVGDNITVKAICRPSAISEDSSVATVNWYKLEEGTKATDWTPAPEDIDGIIVDKIKVVEDKINTVESSIKQDLNGIKMNVQEVDTKTTEIEADLKKVNDDFDSKLNITNSKVSDMNSSLNILKDKVESKVSQSDIDKSLVEVKDSIKATQESVNSVSSSVTQLRDSVTTDISSLKSKTQTIESNLDEKASKLDIQELNTKVAQQKVSLDGITNRVGETETKTSQLEGSINEVNLDLTGKINSGVQSAKDFATSQVNQAKDEAINIASQDATNKANQAQENAIEGANSYTDTQVNITNSKVNSVESSLNILKDKVETKVSQSYVDESLIEVNNTIKANQKEISSVSSSVTQLRDSVNTQISSLTSKTQSLESSLDGKATKQEVSEVSNRVTSIDANLQGITQRVTNTESKTQSLESNLNGKASKQEVQNVKEKVASVEVNLNGITNRVQSTESNINKLDGKLQNTVTKSEFTEFKQNTDSFKFTVEQRSTMNNLVPNSSFEGYGRAWTCNGEFWAGPYAGYDFKGRFCGAIKNANRYNNEKYLMTEKCFRVKKNTTYTLNFKFALEQNVESMDAFVILSDSESTNYGQAIRMYNASGGSQTNNYQEQCITKTFNTGDYEWAWLRFDHNGMKQGVNVNEWCWLYISEVGVYEGDVGQVKWMPSSGETYSSNFLLDREGFKASFDDGSYAYMGKNGFEWYNAGSGHSYHALTYVTSFDIPTGNPGRAYVKLPVEFTSRKSSLKWTVATRGYYYSTTGSFFPFHVHCSGSAPAYEENGQLVCSVEGVCKIQNSNNSNDVQFRPLTAMLIAIA